jgi:SAM-dependent methyltransferase
MTSQTSLGATYFDRIFEGDDDPLDLASSDYEAAKFRVTCDALADRRYACALEVGCAHGVLTEKLVDLCDTLLAVDISGAALAKARVRVGKRAGLEFEQMSFPRETPDGASFDLVILSEVAYYWDCANLARAGEWLVQGIARGGRMILVHYTGETDYPQTGDQAVETLWSHIQHDFEEQRAERHAGYRLDLWGRR